MNEAIILAAISVLIFFLGPIFLRSNAVLVFLSLCASELLVNFISKDLTDFINSNFSYEGYPIYSIVQIFLLAIFPLIILFIYKKSIKSSKIFWQIIPALAAAVTFFVLVIQKLPYDTKIKIEESMIYQNIEQYYQAIIASGIIISFLFLIISRLKRIKKDSEKVSK